MKQAAFEDRFSPRWDVFAAWLEAQGRSGSSSFPDEEFPQRYREICHHLALARDRQYGAEVVDRLNHLALYGHHILYGAEPGRLQGVVEFFGRGFPRLVREEWRATLAAMILFFVPLLGMTALVSVRPEAAYYIIDPRTLSSLQDMYSDSAQALGRRGADGDLAMFAFYIFNNVSIGFRTFAGGILAGVGTVVFLLLNGFHIGAIAGYLTELGLGHNFWSFVAGHSAPELLAIGISGAAGFRLAQALLSPGSRSRKQALVAAARHAVKLMMGAGALFLIAAFIEGFWSAHRWFPNGVKYAVGASLWALLIGYFFLAGRARPAATPAP